MKKLKSTDGRLLKNRKKKQKRNQAASLEKEIKKVFGTPVGPAMNSVEEALINPPNEYEAINHPTHYTFGGIETLDFIEAKGLNYHLGQVVKYISRADYKGARITDLKKARFYLNREIALSEIDRMEDALNTRNPT